MSELPGYFEYLQEAGESSRFWPMTYEQEHGLFVVGSARVPETEFNPFTFNVYEHGIEERDLAVDQIAEHPLMDTVISRPLGSPWLHNWASKNRFRIANEVPGVMRDVYQNVHPTTNYIVDSSGGHWGFNAWVREGGVLNLQVLGDCACMGVSHMGIGQVDGVEHGYAQYELHNTDFPFQVVSLYAGLGHIARLAAQDHPSQTTLFDDAV